jgi:hypothetical protein
VTNKAPAFNEEPIKAKASNRISVILSKNTSLFREQHSINDDSLAMGTSRIFSGEGSRLRGPKPVINLGKAPSGPLTHRDNESFHDNTLSQNNITEAVVRKSNITARSKNKLIPEDRRM